MKKIWVIIINVFIMFAMLTFVVLYSNLQNRNMTQRQTEHFEYTYFPIPLTDDGGYFIDSPSIEFSVNRNCDDLEMTNEFMRFLITNDELNKMASVKRLVTPTRDLSFDSVYAPFGQVPSDRIISPEVLGILDPLTVQLRIAAFRVGKGDITVDEAVSMYGSFE